MGHREKEVFGKRCPDRVGREAKSFRGGNSGGPTTVRTELTGQSSLGSFSVRRKEDDNPPMLPLT
jgi:hypothetical protein